MAGVWRKTMKYLGLVEDDELEGIEHPEQSDLEESPGGLRRSTLATASTSARRMSGEPALGTEGSEAIIRTIPKSRTTSGSIHRAEPKRFNEARELGDRFKEGVPVIMNLQGTEDSIARRLVDFASGLVFAHDGKIELVATRVYLLTPADVEVSAEERERLREGGFYNQF
jgi:cell division inhibitor SepF